MTSEQSINPQALTSEQYALYAAGYLSASAQVQEVALQQGKDFDQEMILVFLHSGAELRVAHAKQLAAREYEVRRSLEEVSPRPLGCGFCFEEDGEEIHPHPECPIGSQPVVLRYTNHRGVTTLRTIVPLRVWFGVTAWHPKPQWFLDAVDVDKHAERSFALEAFGAAQ
jgi:hypothetical protein